MSKVIVENPEMHAKKTVDANGRVYLGSDFEKKEVRITVELVDEEE